MKIPARLKIGGHWVEVVYPYHFKERSDICGQRDGGLNEIRITNVDLGGNQRPESKVAETLLHELIHAADIISAHDIFKDNEKAIEGISEMLFQILRDNKLHFDDTEG